MQFLKGSREMRIVSIIITALFVMTAMSLSYAQEARIGKTIIEEAYPGYREDQEQRMSGLIAQVVYNGLDDERFSLAGDRIESGTEYILNGAYASRNSRPDNYDVPPAFVDNITYDFSGSGFKKTSGHAFLNSPLYLKDVFYMGAAFLTNLVVHEFGHEVVARYVGAEGSKLNFFQKSGGDFFLGTSSVENIDERSILSYTMGGEFFADLAFEHALRDYRNSPNTYNKSLLVASGGDFLWYCIYAFYISGDNPSYDPITISKETGMSRDTLFSVALAKTLINAYRVYSGNDVIVPYFKVDRYSTSLNIIVPFDIGS